MSNYQFNNCIPNLYGMIAPVQLANNHAIKKHVVWNYHIEI